MHATHTSQTHNPTWSPPPYAPCPPTPSSPPCIVYTLNPEPSRACRVLGVTVERPGGAFFSEEIVNEGGNGLVIVRDIDFASHSEETLLPFHGRCHIG